MKFEHVDCQCTDPHHSIRFSIETLEDAEILNERPEFFLEVQLHDHRSFWKRLVVAIKYLFKKPVDYYWDCTSISFESAEKIGILCHQFRARSMNWANKQLDKL